MPSHTLSTEWTKIASKGDFAKIIVTGKAPIYLSTGANPSRGPATPSGSTISYMDLRSDLHASSDVRGAAIMTELRSAPKPTA